MGIGTGPAGRFRTAAAAGAMVVNERSSYASKVELRPSVQPRNAGPLALLADRADRRFEVVDHMPERPTGRTGDRNWVVRHDPVPSSATKFAAEFHRLTITGVAPRRKIPKTARPLHAAANSIIGPVAWSARVSPLVGERPSKLLRTL